jgi:hypothetical protein
VQIPYRGRSFPLLSRVYAYGEHGHTEHELALLEELAKAWPKAGPQPLLLADRGFPKRDVLDWLALREWGFLIRGKSSTVVQDAHGQRFDFLTVPSGTTRCLLQATVLDQLPGAVQVVVRAHPGPQGTTVRWILLTNLPESLLPWATRLYRHRMQPEQTHRDCKQGHFVSGFAVGHLRRLRADRLERLLFCLGLGYAFLNLLAETDRETREWLQRRHWGLSLVTFGLDLLAFLEGRLLPTIRRALRWGGWLPLWLTEEEEPSPSEQAGPPFICQTPLPA